MKKFLTAVVIGLALALSFAFVACGKTDGGTYYPDKTEMSQNMQTKGYQLYSSDSLIGDGTGTFFSAEKGEDYLKFYWLDDPADCDYYYHLLEEGYPDCNVLVMIENDEKFGNLVYCGTSAAVDDSGIRVIKVKV